MGFQSSIVEDLSAIFKIGIFNANGYKLSHKPSLFTINVPLYSTFLILQPLILPYVDPELNDSIF